MEIITVQLIPVNPEPRIRILLRAIRIVLQKLVQLFMLGMILTRVVMKGLIIQPIVVLIGIGCQILVRAFIPVLALMPSLQSAQILLRERTMGSLYTRIVIGFDQIQGLAAIRCVSMHSCGLERLFWVEAMPEMERPSEAFIDQPIAE
jgi:hypothetical protein